MSHDKPIHPCRLCKGIAVPQLFTLSDGEGGKMPMIRLRCEDCGEKGNAVYRSTEGYNRAEMAWNQANKPRW